MKPWFNAFNRLSLEICTALFYTFQAGSFSRPRYFIMTGVFFINFCLIWKKDDIFFDKQVGDIYFYAYACLLISSFISTIQAYNNNTLQSGIFTYILEFTLLIIMLITFMILKKTIYPSEDKGKKLNV